MEDTADNDLELKSSKAKEDDGVDAIAAEVEIQKSSLVSSKKQRNRKRKLLKDIREQMEFYFSDSNLHRDKYLNEKLKESSDGFIPLSVFAKFNKISALTTDVSVLAIALQASSFLQVNSEHKVRRISEIKELTNADDCTVYVENLPKHVTHNWVKKIFKRCGKVTYVSLPKYKKSGDFKGFGFVEFSCPEAVTTACMELNMPSTSRDDSELYSEHSTDDEEVQEYHESLLNRRSHSYRNNMMGKKQDCKDHTVNSHESGNHKNHHNSHSVHYESSSKDQNKAEIHHLRGRHYNDHRIQHIDGQKCDTDNENSKKDQTEAAKLVVSPVKRKVDEDGDTNLTNPLFKKLKTDHDDSNQTKEPEQDKKTVGISIMSNSNDNVTLDSKAKRKPMRKRRRHRRDNVASLHPLHVMPKKQWLELKAQYKAIQKAHVAAIKQSLLLSDASSSSMVHKTFPVIQEVKPLKENQTHVCSQTMVPGVIIKVFSKEPVSNIRKLKDKLKETGYVAYLDLKDGDTAGFVRCKNAESAEKLLKVEALKMFDNDILSGEAEKEYWKKIEEDRKERYAKKSKKRGKVKVVDQIDKLAQEKNKHIFFD